jgi:phage N-6-adenine-methyltransferase
MMNKNTQDTMFSSKSSDWSTPQEFFDKLNWRFGSFDLDPCATPATAKCANFYTEMENGLAKEWESHCSFVNPPYGREIAKWVKKGYDEGQKKNTKVVMLIPARTDTKYWQDYVMKAQEVYFIRGRLKFGESTNSAPFPSAVVVFEGDAARPQIFGVMNR